MGWQSLRRLTIRRESPWFQCVVLGASSVLCLAIALAFSIQPDWCATVLVLPRWLWIAPGLILALAALTKRKKRAATAVMMLWLAFALIYVLELRSLFRWSNSSPKQPNAIRVISLNCSGYIEAAQETAALSPDIILLEESPLRTHLEKAATQIAGPEGESYCGVDVSLVARGKITPVPIADKWSARFSRAHVQLTSGTNVEVIVVRLSPYGIRADLWSLDCWRSQCQIRQLQRSQLQRIAAEIQQIPRDTPLILGGDFNLPAGDKMFRLLEPRIEDAFPKCGTGWGDTLVNDIPFIRIDQIWSDSHFEPISVKVQRTVNTDHRMVICDLQPSGRR